MHLLLYTIYYVFQLKLSLEFFENLSHTKIAIPSFSMHIGNRLDEFYCFGKSHSRIWSATGCYRVLYDVVNVDTVMSGIRFNRIISRTRLHKYWVYLLGTCARFGSTRINVSYCSSNGVYSWRVRVCQPGIIVGSRLERQGRAKESVDRLDKSIGWSRLVER